MNVLRRNMFTPVYVYVYVYVVPPSCCAPSVPRLVSSRLWALLLLLLLLHSRRSHNTSRLSRRLSATPTGADNTA